MRRLVTVIRPEELITHRFPLEKAGEAYALMASGEKFDDFENIERFAFYEKAKKAYAVVMTGESALYANIILKKGVTTF